MFCSKAVIPGRKQKGSNSVKSVMQRCDVWGIACLNEFCSLSESDFWSRQFWCIDFEPHTPLVNKISSQFLACVSKSFPLRQIKYFNLQLLQLSYAIACNSLHEGAQSCRSGGREGRSLEVLSSPLTLISWRLLVPGRASCLQLHSFSISTGAASASTCACIAVAQVTGL